MGKSQNQAQLPNGHITIMKYHLMDLSDELYR